MIKIEKPHAILEFGKMGLTRARKLSEISSGKKLIGYKNAYRIRMGEYRIRFIFENETIEMIRVLGCKEIYKYFPKGFKIEHFRLSKFVPPDFCMIGLKKQK